MFLAEFVRYARRPPALDVAGAQVGYDRPLLGRPGLSIPAVGVLQALPALANQMQAVDAELELLA